jgi:hypothetical protein
LKKMAKWSKYRERESGGTFTSRSKSRADAPENGVATVAEESIGHRTVARGVLGNYGGCNVLPPPAGRRSPVNSRPGPIQGVHSPPVVGLISHGARSYPVGIQVELEGRQVPLPIASNSPPSGVEALARIKFGQNVEFQSPKPITWTANKVYVLKRTTDLAVPVISGTEVSHPRCNGLLVTIGRPGRGKYRLQ